VSLLKITSATLAFGERVLWQDVNLDVQPGEFIALIGANGSGKSMLLKSIIGSQSLTSGSISFEGENPGKNNSQIGYVPQHRASDQGLPLKAKDAVRFGLDGHKYGFSVSKNAEARVSAALQEVDAAHLANKAIGSLSGGEVQRVRVAQAIISNPRLLLADEPLSALDLNHQKRIAELINEQRKRLDSAVIFVTHDLNPVIEYVDRVIYLAQGRHSIGSTEEVMRSDVLSKLYGTEIDVVRSQGRIVVLGAHDHEHHDDEVWR
jgi:zinc/manganese transport system ATP-binding protein